MDNPIKKVVNNLIQMNLTNSASEEVHVCPHCERIVPKIEIEVFEQKRFVQPKCECEVKRIEEDMQRLTRAGEIREVEKKFAQSTLGNRFKNSTFDNFEKRLGTEKAHEMALKYATDFKKWKGDSILIWGDYGNGKSHLAGAVYNSLREQDYIVIFQSVPELLQRIRSTFGNSRETEGEIMSSLFKCDLLILDDIGAEKVTDWVQDALFRIIDGRYRKEKPIMYTSNLKPSLLLEKLGGRIHDRITETSLAIENKASSYRTQKAKERFKRFADGEM